LWDGQGQAATWRKVHDLPNSLEVIKNAVDAYVEGMSIPKTLDVDFYVHAI
jgi:hypothetical protein